MYLDTLKLMLTRMIDKGKEIEGRDHSIDMRSFMECLQETKELLDNPPKMIEAH